MCLSRRTLVLVPVLLLFVLAVSCKKEEALAPHGKGWGKPTIANVTVHITATQAIPNPDPVEISVREPDPPYRAGRIVWQADLSTAVLNVEVDPPLHPNPPQQGSPKCITGIHCSGPTCIGIANAGWYNAANGQITQSCKYRIWANGMIKPNDPTVVVDNCCP